MEIRAISKSVRMSPRKIRLVADMIRRLPIENALFALQASGKRAALPLAKTLSSAVANAVNNAGLDKNILFIESINISEGSALKRFIPSTRGRIHPYKRRSSIIRIVLKAKEPKAVQKKSPEKSRDTKLETGKKADIKNLPVIKENKKMDEKKVKKGGKS